LTSDISSVQDFIRRGVIVFGSNTLLRPAWLILMFWPQPEVCSRYSLDAPLMFWIVYRHKRLIQARHCAMHAQHGLLASLAQESAGSIRIVHAAGGRCEPVDERFQGRVKPAVPCCAVPCGVARLTRRLLAINYPNISGAIERVSDSEPPSLSQNIRIAMLVSIQRVAAENDDAVFA